MSSWDAYSQSMSKSGLTVHGIYSLCGDPWVQSPAMKVTQQEVCAIVSGIQAQNRPSAVHVGGMKCMLISGSDEKDAITVKGRGAAKDDENYLLRCAIAKTCVVIGGRCGPSERDATKAVDDLRDYLVKNNY